MRLINEILYIEWAEALESGIPKGTLDSAVNRNAPSWSFIDDPEDKRRVLIDYDKLSNTNKDKVKARFGNPYNYVARQPIKNMVKWDQEAEAFFLNHRYATNKSLPMEHVEKYTKAASWLNMLKEATADKKTLKKLLNLSIDHFYNHVIELIGIEKIDLPSNYRKLLAKRKKYEETGYESLIDWRFGNNLAAKVSDEISEAALIEMLQHPNQYDDVFICQQYNIWAPANGYKTIDSSTVGVHRRKNDHNIIMFREGNSALNEKYLKQVKGQRPTNPLYLVESDDNHLDLLFLDVDDPNNGSKHSHRYKAIVVIDSFNDYVLGYAYSEDLTMELVKAAYLNAMYYIRSLTGAWHLPHEIKSDRWAQKTLFPFYESLGKLVPPSLGNKHRGYIEQFFGTPHWKRCMKAFANNYTGNNITAKNRGVNTDALGLNKKHRPLLGSESIEQVEQFFHRLRHMPQSNGISKHDQWMEAWSNMPSDKKRQITDEQFLLKCGIVHNHHDEGIRITNRGVEPRINNVKYSYDLEEYDMSHINKSVSVVYDPYDMSRVLVTDFDKIRLIARDARIHSRALEDAHLDSRTYLNIVLEQKRKSVSAITEASDQRKKVLQDFHIDAETLLQEGIIVKELRQVAEKKFLNPPSDQGNDPYNVFNQY